MISTTPMDEEIFAEGLEELKHGARRACAEFGDYVGHLGTSIADYDKTNGVFRALHNLKALAMWFNLDGTYVLFSQLEDALFRIREQRLVFEPKMHTWFTEAQRQLEAFSALVEHAAGYHELRSQCYALPQLQEQDMTPNHFRLREITVLYAEDDPGIQAPFAKFLRRRVKNLILASDGADALEKYTLHRPDIVITDINMPHLHGLKLIEEIRKIDPSRPVIITSAHNEKPFRYQAGVLGITSYLVKPFNFEDLELELIYSLV